jgi:hypothetical protein
VDRFSRLTLLILLVAFAVWRLVRYMKMGMARRPAGLVSGAGMLVQPTAPTSKPATETLAADKSARTRTARLLGALAGLGFWLLCNGFVIWALFGSGLFQNAPPLILMVIVVLPNFYLVPLARRLADRWPPVPAARWPP